eukprot:4689916-Amphidinium_carterae.2
MRKPAEAVTPDITPHLKRYPQNTKKRSKTTKKVNIIFQVSSARDSKFVDRAAGLLQVLLIAVFWSLSNRVSQRTW